ncbi:hypothetical protein M3152_09165 [Sporosarcina luteola]|uniref:hypothetical protein n=1 Tax=Sporosarcina luteola TaxID=582850 RepID=UPI00203EFB80|nr:hypothetical protein [Sporosarcina luteola]MCM3637893.1 hypothetical protein [Sporosarcina luteola]
MLNNSSIPRLSNQSIPVSQLPLTMREGQMFHGQIKQLFPGQMAEVQIGGQKLMAKLEVPMKAGDAYYFQVKSVTPELQIIVVSGPLQATEGQAKQMTNLIDSMQLPKSPEMVTVLNHFLKDRLPVSKDILLNAVELLKTVPPSLQNEAHDAIQKLVELKLPLNEFNFNSLLGVEKKEGLHDGLTALRNALLTDTGIPMQSKERILATVGDAGRIAVSAAEKALVSGAVLKLLDESIPREERFQVLQLLKSSGIMPASTTLANLQTIIDTTMAERVAGAGQIKDLIQNDPVLQQAYKLQLIGLLDEMEPNRSVETRSFQAGEQAGKIMRLVAEHIQSMPFFSDDEASAVLKLLLPDNARARIPELYRMMEQSSMPVAKELMQGAQTIVEQAIDGKVMKEAMQSLFKSLGFNYEAGLLSGNHDIAKTMDMLKPQLVALLHDSAVSPALRDAAETMVARMNGSLIQSGDTGVNQQIVMQLPLEFLGKRVDATIQWNGRKKADGKIDADFARILFYLELESIDKTVVDMQVQNRVVAITVFNENYQLREIGGLLQMKLKDGLESVDYRLSGVTFKQFEEEGNRETKRRNDKMSEQGGVDFRI